MIKSMTGFGRGSVNIDKGQINVEIQSLNSRYIDLKFSGFNLSPEVEDNFRRIISSELIRGSIKVIIEIDNIKNDQVITLNHERFQKSVSILDDIDKRYGQKLKLNEVINLNDILSFSSSEFPHENKIIDALKNALVELNKMRISEGKQLFKDLISHHKLHYLSLAAERRLAILVGIHTNKD